MKKLIPIIVVCLLSFSSTCFGYQVKGYTWGTPLNKIQEELTQKDIQTVYDEKKDTLVYDDVKYGKECKVSLLFTPKSERLAGVAFLWEEKDMFKPVRQDLERKYGRALEMNKDNVKVKQFLWYSPTSSYDRISLISTRKGTVVGYFGGEYYKQYKEEDSR